jgi:hypothetical protein
MRMVFLFRPLTKASNTKNAGSSSRSQWFVFFEPDNVKGRKDKVGVVDGGIIVMG